MPVPLRGTAATNARGRPKPSVEIVFNRTLDTPVVTMNKPRLHATTPGGSFAFTSFFAVQHFGRPEIPGAGSRPPRRSLFGTLAC
jgi:hypothetical protein